MDQKVQPTIRISESFVSLQGESLRSGHKSTFVRIFGCSLKCPGFGLHKGEQNTEIPMIINNIGQYNHYDDLPLSKTGCDSYPSSWSEFKKFSPEFTFEQLANRLIELNPDDRQHTDLVFTGGEPLLKPTQRKLVQFFEQYSDLINSYQCLTFETNGTQAITDEMQAWLSLRCKIPVIFSVSPKLECSGEPEKRRIIPAAIESIKNTVAQIKRDNEYVHKTPVSNVVDATVYLKYVVRDEADVQEALINAKMLGFEQYKDGDIYLMPVGGTFEEYVANQKTIAELSIKYNCAFCPRVHCMIWKNEWNR